MTALAHWYQRRHLKVVPYLFILPNMLVFTVFLFVPILFTFAMSLFDWTVLGGGEYIGLANFKAIWRDKNFWTSLWNTFYYTIGTVPFTLALGLAGAILLNRKIPLRGFFRTAIYSPVVVSLVVAGLTWQWILNDNYGILNYALAQFGIKGYNWLNDPRTAMPAVIMTTYWFRLGYTATIYLAGLQGIPDVYYEAAGIDGATAWQKFWHVTLPLLRPTTVFLSVMSVIYGFMSFDLVYTMTNGGPGYATTVMTQYIYQKAFTTNEMGYASAMGVILFLMILVPTIIQLRGRASES